MGSYQNRVRRSFRPLAAAVTRTVITGLACALMALAAPTAAHPESDDDPKVVRQRAQADGVEANATAIYNPDTGRPVGSLSPGTRFYFVYELVNTNDHSVTVNDVDSEVWTTVAPEYQDEVPIDYCDQFILETPVIRETFPKNLDPGEAIRPLSDNVNYMLSWDTDNYCRRMTVHFELTPVLAP
ncbi:hypothetical protein H1V43_24355 [Streptomyces sp. PSKA54]|uniref:Uncharacterized protein n=1 Tax=Streptomyces himalayensis subsp. aureolus TaxID=2758039 RepID=A0A7W2D489_9ACTN|nr:hypothetical protein [Streptomyces himalayensis]MBA4864428.1 hypothetical protein [Streptomyces himalayensis subsp. aureolus]